MSAFTAAGSTQNVTDAGGTNRPPILETHSLTRTFGDVTAAADVTFAIQNGESFGLLGPNGAGKSTVIKMLTTLLPPSGGSATIAGLDIVRQASEVRRVIGYVPQAMSSDGTLTGYENLLIFAKLYRLPRVVRQDRIRQAIELMGLGDAAHRLVRTYSGGMVRRLEIAQSVLHRPPLVFLDEPTLGLDPVARQTVWNYVEELRRDFGTTILMTTHYMEEVEEHCDRVAIMYAGRIAVMGSPASLRASVGPEATLEDVFTHYASAPLSHEGQEGGFREAASDRRTR